MKKDIASGQAYPDGVKPLNVFTSKDFIMCYTEAPSADDVHKHHQEAGIDLGPGDVSEVTSLV